MYSNKKKWRPLFKWAIGLVIFLGILGLAIVFVNHSPHKIDQLKNTWLPGLPLVSNPQETVSVKLYFASRVSAGLVVENRVITKYAQPADQGREIISQLINGPQSNELIATIPEGTNLNGLYLDQTGCAFLDFSFHIIQNHPGGSTAELQTIYSLVNSLTANLDTVNRVKILVDGSEIDTLAGHIDTRYPFTPNNLQ
jgi:spore germination protein GerM